MIPNGSEKSEKAIWVANGEGSTRDTRRDGAVSFSVNRNRNGCGDLSDTIGFILFCIFCIIGVLNETNDCIGIDAPRHPLWLLRNLIAFKFAMRNNQSRLRYSGWLCCFIGLLIVAFINLTDNSPPNQLSGFIHSRLSSDWHYNNNQSDGSQT